MATIEGKILPPEVDPRINMDDPPIFLLQALPTFAPWLQDGQYQRVPIGTAGQVLQVNADGSVGWTNASGGFTSPMTTTGDMIYSNPGATPVRLPIGANGNVLVTNTGVPVWTAPPWMTNPMTTPSDLILGGTAGAPTRLAAGGNGQVLTTLAGVVSWQNAASGFTNPMTTLGDIITAAGGGAAQRLGVGSNTQVLTVVSGQPAWANSATGFANPMTTTGDIITSNPGATPTRLGIGSVGQVLTVSGGAPVWANPFSVGVLVTPSTDTSGVTDQANITNTWVNGPLANGGTLYFAPGKFYVKPTSGLLCLQPPAQTNTSPNNGGSPVSFIGSGMATVLYPVGAGVTGIYYHRTNTYGAQFNNPAQQAVGYMRDFCIDGTNTSGAAIGLDIGDGWGDSGGVHLHVSNFDTAGAIGVNIINRVFWTEKWRFWLDVSNCTTAVYMTTNIPGSDHSHEYNYFDIVMFANQNQQGVVIDGVNMGGSSLFLKGNMCQTTATSGAPTGNVAALSIINTTGQNNTESRWYFGEIWMKVEFNQTAQFPTGSVAPYGMFFDGVARGVQECTGAITHSLTNSKLNGAEFSFRGLIGGDPNLAQAFPVAGSPHATSTSQPSVPASGTPLTNGGPDMTVGVTGANITGVSINGNPTGASTGASSAFLGPFFVCAAGAITLNYTGATPTWNWVPAAQSS